LLRTGAGASKRLLVNRVLKGFSDSWFLPHLSKSAHRVHYF
jgi:hypothetical protein